MSASWSTPGPPRDNGRSRFERLSAQAVAALSGSCSSKPSCSARQPRPLASGSPDSGIAQGFAIYAAQGNDALPYFLRLDMPWAAYVYVVMLTVLAAAIVGVLPALHATGRRAQDTLKQASGTDGLRLGRVWTVMIVAQVAIAMIGLPTTIKISWDGIQRGLTKANYSEESFLAAILSADPDAPAGMPASVYARESVLRFEKSKTDLVTGLEAEPAVDDVTVAATIPGAEPRARIAIDGKINVQAGELDV